MAEAARIVASITVTGDHLNPDEITVLLGCPPDESGRVGDAVSARSTAKRRTGFWTISSTGLIPDTASLARHVESLLTRVTTDAAAWRELATHHSARVFVGWFMDQENEGTGLDAEVLHELALRRLTLDFDVYSPPEATRRTARTARHTRSAASGTD